MLWAAMDRYCDVTMLWPLLFHGIHGGPEWDNYERPGNGDHMEVSGRGRSAVGPAAADFPRDVCLTVSRNHINLIPVVASR